MLRPLPTLLLVGLLATTVAGCSDDGLVAPTTAQAQKYLDIYTGTLEVGATGFFSFPVNTPGTTAVTLGNLLDAATGRVLDTPLELGIGIPAGEGCHVTTAVTVPPGLKAQVLQSLTAGVYCVRLRDVGQLRTRATFGVRISHT